MMQENNSILIKLVKEKLDWYITEATDAEYDEAEVEALQRTLDEMEPLEEGVMPDTEEAWKRFREKVEEAECEKISDEVQTEEMQAQKSFPENKSNKLVKFVLRHKSVVAAVILVLVLAVGMGVQTEAFKSSGFFYWLKNDESGMQMVTSPDGLDGMTEVVTKNEYHDKENIPDWVKEWENIKTEVMNESEYVWEKTEVAQYANRNMLCTYYVSEIREIAIGTILYSEEISVSTEVFLEYDLVKTIDLSGAQMNVYMKKEQNEAEYYVVGFFYNNAYCYVVAEYIEEAQFWAEQYYGELSK